MTLVFVIFSIVMYFIIARSTANAMEFIIQNKFAEDCTRRCPRMYLYVWKFVWHIKIGKYDL